MKTVAFNDCYLNKMGRVVKYMVLWSREGGVKKGSDLRGCEATGRGEFGLTGLSTNLFYCIIYHVINECSILSKARVLS